MKTKHKDFEIIVIDDKSDERIDDLAEEFSLKLTRVEDKWYKNPAVPINLGISKAEGDIIIIQNPECLHVHDILTYMNKKVNDSNYISASCYSINEEMNKKRLYFKTFPQQKVENYVGWYNHPVYNPTHYNFCAGLTRKNMTLLGGFDERYAMGIGFEDNEFIRQIDKLGLKKIIIDKVVIHQWHPKVYDTANPEHLALFRKNAALFKMK